MDLYIYTRKKKCACSLIKKKKENLANPTKKKGSKKKSPIVSVIKFI
jgi:hypothetical protein